MPRALVEGCKNKGTTARLRACIITAQRHHLLDQSALNTRASGSQDLRQPAVKVIADHFSDQGESKQVLGRRCNVDDQRPDVNGEIALSLAQSELSAMQIESRRIWSFMCSLSPWSVLVMSPCTAMEVESLKSCTYGGQGLERGATLARKPPRTAHAPGQTTCQHRAVRRHMRQLSAAYEPA